MSLDQTNPTVGHPKNSDELLLGCDRLTIVALFSLAFLGFFVADNPWIALLSIFFLSVTLPIARMGYSCSDFFGLLFFKISFDQARERARSRKEKWATLVS